MAAKSFFTTLRMHLTSKDSETRGADHAIFLITELTGPAVWVGLPDSAFGPEVGLLSIGATILGLGLLSWMVKIWAKHTNPIKN